VDVARKVSDVGFSPPESQARSSGEDAAQYIRRLIFDGELRPGERIPQDEIAAALGRSRVPVREALFHLVSEGWVDIVLNRGAYVSKLTESSVYDQYALLGFTYGLAARRVVEQDVEGLDDKLEVFAAGLRDTEDLANFNRSALAFHDAIVGAADSPRIRSVLRSLSAIVPGNFFAEVPGSVPVEKKGVNAIRRAIASRDSAQAAEAYRAMIERHGAQVVRLLKKRGLFDTA
jgi:DNA-binding GntR family transcriptional regulator